MNCINALHVTDRLQIRESRSLHQTLSTSYYSTRCMEASNRVTEIFPLHVTITVSSTKHNNILNHIFRIDRLPFHMITNIERPQDRDRRNEESRKSKIV